MEISRSIRAALELELDEQLKPLTAYERSKGIVRRKEELLAAFKTNCANMAQLKPGPKPTYNVPKREVAKAIGVSEMTLIRAE